MGDENNKVLHSLIKAVALFYFHLRMAISTGSKSQEKFIHWVREWGHILCIIRKKQLKILICIITDVGVSMGQEFCARSHSIFSFIKTRKLS
ncbi:hypothetical protein [Bartonella elizabethae]